MAGNCAQSGVSVEQIVERVNILRIGVGVFIQVHSVHGSTSTPSVNKRVIINIDVLQRNAHVLGSDESVGAIRPAIARSTRLVENVSVDVNVRTLKH